ncbi:MAG TPA: hypothetical protein VD861_13035 [Pyrinomonadaceae bacterium]|nr:hypothetical protein [Pyrinomonadaceae bacterium]
MSIQVSCPVFRCPRNSIKRCEGYGRACERYYCRTHTEGHLCDRCAAVKIEDMKSSYKDILNDLARKSFSASMTAGVAALFVLSILLIGTAVASRFLQNSSQDGIPFFVFTLGGGMLGFLVATAWYFAKNREYMRAQSLELDKKYPGFYELYEKWQKNLDDATSNSNF